MNIKKYQLYIDYSVKNWDNVELSSRLHEICDSTKEYENDRVEVHQFVDLGKRKGEWNYLIILNLIRDLDDLGKPIESPYK